MEAAAALSGDKAQRIVDAMRASVAARGAAGSTFDHVAREAGVSRGLLHYYFGTKERLLVEVVRRDSRPAPGRARRGARGRRAAPTTCSHVLVRSLEELVERDPAFVALHFELFTSSRRTPEIAAELAALHRRIREHVAGQLEAKQAEGVIAMTADAEAVVTSCSRSPTASRCGCSPIRTTIGGRRWPRRCRRHGRCWSELPVRACEEAAGRHARLRFGPWARGWWA